MKTPTPATEDQVARLGKTWGLLGISARTGHYWIEKGILPKPLALGPRARGYRMSTLRAFLDSRQGASL